MKSRILVNGDLALENGSVKRASNLKEVIKQNISCKLRTIEGECFSNQNHGLPFFNGILGESELSMPLIQDTIRKSILNVNDVKDVENISLSFEDRKMIISYKVSTNYGELEGSL
jgi:hypothetical protein